MVKTGYKQTKIGVIPEDWTVSTLGELGQFQNGINKNKEEFGYGNPFVNLMDVFGVNAIFNTGKLGLINSNESEQSLYDLREGDVLFIRSSVKPSGVGLTAVLLQDLPKTVYSGFIIRFRDNGNLSTEFKKYCFFEYKFRKSVIANSTVSANTNINQNSLKKLLIAHPTNKREQRAIADALSDGDALISALDKLIAKKRDIKTGTMQQLLTGKKRLPGFSGEWIKEKLGDISDVSMGQSPSSLFYNKSGDGLPLIQGNADIKERRAIIGNYTSQITKRCSKGDIILSVRAPVGEVAKSDFEACIGRGVCAISYPNEFLYHYLIYIEPTWGKLSKGSTFDSVNSNEVKTLRIQLPKDPKEQEEIAEVLDDMDATIKTLKKRQNKIRAIKQGMMQELLTGKTRLL